MGWKETDESLIRRGELILDPSLLENHEKELKTMNKGRRGRPYLHANTYIQLLSVIRYLYGLPYRQLEGFTRVLHNLPQPSDPPTTQASGNASYASASTPTGT